MLGQLFSASDENDEDEDDDEREPAESEEVDDPVTRSRPVPRPATVGESAIEKRSNSALDALAAAAAARAPLQTDPTATPNLVSPQSGANVNPVDLGADDIQDDRAPSPTAPPIVSSPLTSRPNTQGVEHDQWQSLDDLSLGDGGQASGGEQDMDLDDEEPNHSKRDRVLSSGSETQKPERKRGKNSDSTGRWTDAVGGMPSRGASGRRGIGRAGSGPSGMNPPLAKPSKSRQ